MAGHREAYLKLAEADYDTVKSLFDSMIAYKAINEMMKDEITDERKDWTFEDWQKRDPQGLAKLKADNGGRYPEYLLKTLKSVK